MDSFAEMLAFYQDLEAGSKLSGREHPVHIRQRIITIDGSYGKKYCVASSQDVEDALKDFKAFHFSGKQ